MDFEYDINKSLKNKDKHGIDFEEAKLLWNDKNSLIVPANMVDNEMRHAMISTLDKKFDKGEDISEYLDFSKAVRLNEFEKTSTKKINVDFPEHIIKLLDNEAQKIGVTRQSIIKVWIAERLKEEQKQQLTFPR